MGIGCHIEKEDIFTPAARDIIYKSVVEQYAVKSALCPGSGTYIAPSLVIPHIVLPTVVPCPPNSFVTGRGSCNT